MLSKDGLKGPEASRCFHVAHNAHNDHGRRLHDGHSLHNFLLVHLCRRSRQLDLSGLPQVPGRRAVFWKNVTCPSRPATQVASDDRKVCGEVCIAAQTPSLLNAQSVCIDLFSKKLSGP